MNMNVCVYQHHSALSVKPRVALLDLLMHTLTTIQLYDFHYHHDFNHGLIELLFCFRFKFVLEVVILALLTNGVLRFSLNHLLHRLQVFSQALPL